MRATKLLASLALALLVLIFLGALLADRLMPDASGPPSSVLAVQPDATVLDRAMAPLLAAHPGQSGAILVNDGLDAFAVRALAARGAGRSLDLQYYMWRDDLCGRLLALEVWRAAERGVRVRLLLDDMNAYGLDAQMLALAHHPNVEIRLYNAFRNRHGIRRVFETLVRALRVNHRMHNKAWIADGRMAIVGGRNIGEEYFDTAAETNFRDLDMVLLGPAVAGAESVFDRYWNDPAVVPLRAVADKNVGRVQRSMTGLETKTVGDKADAYLGRVLASPGVAAFMSGALSPIWSTGIEVVADPPQKWSRDDRGQWLVRRLVDTIASARTNVSLISPYFVPGEDSTQQLVGLVHGGVAAGVVTNSLAANDVPAVHSGYARYREPLLAGGVKLYELRARGHMETSGLFGSSGASLHTKAFLVDGRRGFIGSFNLDMRSAALNTEMGVLFDDPQIGAALGAEYQRLAAPSLSYAVQLQADGSLQWIDGATRPPRTLEQEPDASLVRRIAAKVLGWLPIESQL
jgi:putative cardiolipin synthase